MKRILLGVFLLIFSTNTPFFAQEMMAELDEKLEESSALIVVNDSTFLTINDSGNEPIVYIFNIAGEITHSCFISNAKNIDWEALAFDGDNRLFIGDIGDNKNKRKKRTVYQVYLDEVLTQDTVESSFIHFSYAEQSAFPPQKDQLYYDAEGMIFKNDSLFIFTKNRTKPFDGIVKVYRLNLRDSIQTLGVSFELQLAETNWMEDSVTDAFYENNTLLLLTYSKIYYFDWKNQVPVQVDYKCIETVTQKEGIFMFKDVIYLTDEASPFGTQRLYTLSFWK